MNEFLKRGKGKKTGDIKKYDFFSFYRKNAKETKLERKQYDAFVKNLLSSYSELIVKENLELKLDKIGYIRVQAKPLHFVTKEGKLAKSLKVNWKATWEMWEQKYPGLSKDEITNLTNKKVIYFENSHSNQEFYSHLWDNKTALLKFKSFYKFKPSRQYSRLISKVVKEPNRKVFYYG
jgi:hypothetical protein